MLYTLFYGGGPWFNTWKCKTNTLFDVDGFFGLVPLFKPPVIKLIKQFPPSSHMIQKWLLDLNKFYYVYIEFAKNI
ncbi:hypothetical protein ACOSP7_018466 [Xanthoceras sorbifolium]